jgi:hypothetical protein
MSRTNPGCQWCSLQAEAVLRHVAATTTGALPVVDVVARLDPLVALSVRRASLSRSLCRLWRAGLVELADADGQTLTEHRRWKARTKADPEAAYEEYKASGPDYCGSLDAFWLARFPVFCATQVQITSAGRARLSVNSDLPETAHEVPS